MKRLLLALAVALGILGIGSARAQDPCQNPPFTDINQNDVFCEAAVWAANANITLGCGGGLFCPFDPVSRAQMVLFLHRMANWVFPQVVFSESAAPPSGDLDAAPGVTACSTTSFPLPAPPENGRFWHAHAVVSMQGGASDADVQVSVSQSVGGAFLPPFSTALPVVSVPAGQWRNATVQIGTGPPMFGGTSYSWRINLVRAPGSATTGDLAGLRCQLKIVIVAL